MRATTFATGLLMLAPLGLLSGCSSDSNPPTSNGPSGGTGSAGTGATAGAGSGGMSGTAAGGSAGNATGASGGSTSGAAGTTGATGGSMTGGTAGAAGGAGGSATGGVAGSTGGTAGTTTGGGAGAATGGMGGAAGSNAGAGGAAAAGNGGTSGESGSGGDYPLGNPAVPSAGCEVGSTTLGNGTHELTSAGLEREYIVSLPSNYDPTKPYRLVFGMHWLGGSADAVNNDGWFRLKPLDTENSTIWVAPQGYTDDSPWRGGDDKDHVFFEELVALLESELCVDVSRIFSVGFSFGAMYTNSLAQTHQDILRGVVVYATADYNIYFPENTGEPLAYMGVHGDNDDLCPITSGRNSKDRFVENNGCTEASNVPEATSGTHVTFDYECENYPVRWSTFQGGHSDQPTDPGQSRSWAMDESWEFITQF